MKRDGFRSVTPNTSLRAPAKTSSLHPGLGLSTGFWLFCSAFKPEWNYFLTLPCVQGRKGNTFIQRSIPVNPSEKLPGPCSIPCRASPHGRGARRLPPSPHGAAAPALAPLPSGPPPPPALPSPWGWRGRSPAWWRCVCVGCLQLPFLLRSLGAGGRRLLRWPETGASRPAPLAASRGGSPLGSAG